jgi:hypothetical protein
MDYVFAFIYNHWETSGMHVPRLKRIRILDLCTSDVYGLAWGELERDIWRQCVWMCAEMGIRFEDPQGSESVTPP